MVNKTFLFALFIMIAACGKNSNSGISHETTIVPETLAGETSEIVSSPGIYRIDIKSLNPKVIKFSATGSLIHDENEITIAINAKRVSPLRSTYQVLFEGECPTYADDRNGDGYLDISEAKVHLIKSLIPLDADINSSSEEHTGFPTASLFGRYNYKVKGNKVQIQSDIQKKFGALKVDWEKTVVVFFQTIDETLPVACGNISLK